MTCSQERYRKDLSPNAACSPAAREARMSDVAMYHDGSRGLQDAFGSRRLADRLVEKLVHEEFTDAERRFIESRPMFFLATADADGRPDCSYKAGGRGSCV
jgi:uncharacterized protein